jgi:hypothetical protein
MSTPRVLVALALALTLGGCGGTSPAAAAAAAPAPPGTAPATAELPVSPTSTVAPAAPANGDATNLPNEAEAKQTALAWLTAFLDHNEAEVAKLSAFPLFVEGGVLGPDEVMSECGANQEGVFTQTVEDRAQLTHALKCFWTDRSLGTLSDGLATAAVKVDNPTTRGVPVSVHTDDNNGMTYDALLTIQGAGVASAKIRMHFEH